MIGKQVYHKETLEEFEVVFVENIGDTTIVYTNNNKSFSIEDICVTPFQNLIDKYGKTELINFLNSQFKPMTDGEFENLLESKSYPKTFKIFGWTITFSKSK
jgi:hypothetical protein